MAHIHVLDKHTAELIAAGEVVERPASVVKELTENAIDAGASVITVEICHGGVACIRITDNGCGFAREDVPTAFLRHATSKISREADLDNIMTLGFRGEALASVAAVAKVELMTRTETELAGTRYVIEGGQEISLSDIGCARGSTIYVRDLFYNVPARMKFLKTDTGEANAVAAVVDRLALSHPEISFRFIRDEREELLTPGSGDQLACIGSVLGREFVSTLIPLDYTLGGVRVHGYICRPGDSRANRTMQHFFVNGRYVKTRTAMAALEQAYKGAVMVGRFPACVLHIDLPPETVDANVHPAKIEVRFVNEKPVFDAVYHGVRSCLEGDTTPRKAVLKDIRTSLPLVTAPTPIAPPVTARETSRRLKTPDEKEPFLNAPMVSRMPARVDTGVVRDTVNLFAQPPVSAAEAQPAPEVISVPKQPTLLDDQPVPVKYVGEVLHTYIVAEWKGSVYLIDKHAAHERLLYNELKAAEQHESQCLLIPVPVTLSKEEYGAVIEASESLEKVGFDLEDFGGGSVLVRAVPVLLAEDDIPNLLGEIAAGLLAGHRDISTRKLDWIYHSVACRAAVKAGDRNGAQELAALAQRVLCYDDIRSCPHGRPVCIELTEKELEKQFGRIV